ncbi:MAG TPA: hypothetical protein VLM89_10520, partial [Phycisphaerae bacterium]|nr:hypothetical protein [Phycisphaerae bacterium]
FPPGLSSMKWVCYYPEFMNRPPEQLLSRDIRAPVGSRVELSLTADKPVRSIELAIRNHSGLQREPVPLTADYQGAASFIIRSPGWYQIALTDLDGITDDDPPTYRIVPIENPRPTVTLLGPPAELTVTPSARVPIEFEAEDGPTVTAATIVWRRPLADTADTQPAARVPIPLPGPAKNIRQSFEWALASIESRPGELLSWYIEVDDQAEHMNPRRPGEGMSGACTLSVVDTATFIRQHQDRLQAALNEIDDLAAETARSWDEVSAILNLLENKKPPPGTDLPAQLRPVHERQALSAKRLQALIGSIEHLLTEWTFSFPAGTAPRGTQLLANILVRAAQGPLRNLLDDWDRAITQSQASPESRPALGSTLRQIQQHQTSLLETLAALSGARPKASSELSASGPARENVNIQANAFEQLQTTLANNMERIARVDTPGKSPKVSPGRRPPRETPPPAAPVAAGSRNGRAVPATGATGTIVGHRDLLPMAAPVRADPGSPPWYWRLPDRQREILRQATTEPLPPDHAEAIRLYYDLLNQLSESQP